MNIRAVIFDRDNTLLRFEQGVVDQRVEQIAALAPSLSNDVITAAWESWSGPWPLHPADEQSFWRAFWHALVVQHGIPAELELTLREIGSDYHTCFSAFPDAAACIEALHRQGLRLGVLTNFELPGVARTLTHAGLDVQLFSALLSARALGLPKPNPSAYRAIATVLRQPLHACAYVDDLPEHVAAARALGMRAFLLDRSCAHDDPAAGVLCSLAGLPELLRPPSAHDQLQLDSALQSYERVS